tara:strand:- start:106 stop:450 length:345 start_codon:yes stop_codon:yes gene_type:complete
LNYKLYGIKNCDTVKKAIKELDSLGIVYEFIDFKKFPPKKEWILLWEEFWGDLPANKRGPTFRKIRDEYESCSKAKKISLLIEKSSAVKRPILEKDDKVLSIGFKQGDYSAILK